MPCTKSYVQNSALDVGTSLYEPYRSFSSVFISIKTVSVARDHRWSTTPAIHYPRNPQNSITASIIITVTPHKHNNSKSICSCIAPVTCTIITNNNQTPKTINRKQSLTRHHLTRTSTPPPPPTPSTPIQHNST